MDAKLFELALVVGGLWLLWRSANRIGAEGRAGNAAQDGPEGPGAEDGAGEEAARRDEAGRPSP